MAFTTPSHPATLTGKVICLVTSGHIGSNPRLVKEAEALSEAGAFVQVIALDITSLREVQARDESVMAGALWRCLRIDCKKGKIGRKARALARRLAQQGWSWGLRGDRLLELAFDPLISKLTTAARGTKADLYIAHNLAALPAAFHAARAHGGKLGFDAEDFHSGELADPAAAQSAMARGLETRYLPLCDYVTAASPGIARAYAQTCAIPEPTVLLNVFGRHEAPSSATPQGAAQERPSLYWFSQTIGPGRGLECAIEAIALSRSRPALYLQGTVASGYGAELGELSAQLGLQGHVRFVPPAPPGDLVRLAAQYDIGLASEETHPLNRDLCLTNKVFTYLLAGIPTVASATTAQAELGRQLTGGFHLYPPGQPQALAKAIDHLLLSPEILATERAEAWHHGQARYNWDTEKTRFLDVVQRVLQTAP